MNAKTIMLYVSYIILMVLTTYVFVSIVNFFGIAFSAYINYLLFILAMLVFSLILPSKTHSIFNKN
jgi:hypothetical protein